MGWNVGLTFWNWIKIAVYRIVPHDIPKEEEIQECSVPSRLQPSETIMWNYNPGNQQCNLLYWNTKKSQCLPLFSLSHKENVKLFLLPCNTRPQRSVWTNETIRSSVRSTRGLGLTMTARGQSIGISIGMLPQTEIMSITVPKTSKYYTTEFDLEEGL